MGVSPAGLTTWSFCPREVKPLPPRSARTLVWPPGLSLGGSLFLSFLPALLSLGSSTLQVLFSKKLPPTGRPPAPLLELCSTTPLCSPILTQ